MRRYRPSPLESLLRRYDLGEIHGFQPLAEGLLNRSYEVFTERGRYFLKHYLEPDEARIAASHRITAAMAEAGVPVVTPLTNRLGRTLSCYQGRVFALYPWVSGRHHHGLDLTLSECAALGDLLGRVHLTLASVAPPCQQPLFTPTVSAEAATQTADRLLDLVRAKPQQDWFDELAARRLIERRELIKRFAGHRPHHADQPLVGHVHGDFHPLNVIYRAKRRQQVIVDWDRIAAKPHVDEVVRAALLFFIDKHGGWLDLSRIREFASGYAARNPRVAAEFALGVHRLWWERLTDFWMLHWRYQRGDARCDPQFPAAAALVVWWTEAYDEVIAAFT